MSLSPKLGLRQRVGIGLAPSLRTSLNVLRMPLADLQAELARAAAENPYLVFRQHGPQDAGGGADFLVETPSLVADLRRQIGLMPLAPEVRAVAEYLAGELREDGYLDTDLDEIAAEIGIPQALAEAGLAALQDCEPAGVGARSLSECLALQLVDRGVAADLAAQVVVHLEAFVAQDWRSLRCALGLARADLEAIGALLPQLVPHPVVPSPAAASALLPDLRVTKAADGTLSVELTRLARPQLALDAALAAHTARDAPGAQFRARAEVLIAAIAARGATLLRLGAWIVTAQAEFFSLGPDHLRPLSRAAAAADLGVHPSTVGRAVAGKAIEAEGRVYPLSRFFAAPLPQAQGPALSGFVVRRRIARLIADEPPGTPLSDAAIRAALAAEGVDIARRTVTKYRQWMRVPSSHQRRRQMRLRAAAARTGEAGMNGGQTRRTLSAGPDDAGPRP